MAKKTSRKAAGTTTAKKPASKKPASKKATPRKAASKKATVKKPLSKKKAAKRGTKKKAASKGARVTVRMYRLGVGDCFLVRLWQGEEVVHTMLIDCGVHQSQTGGSALVQQAVDDIVKETGGKLDTLVVTHEHWDHVSGFSQAKESFDTFTVGELWAAWTEDAGDKLAKTLKDKRKRAMALVGEAAQQLVALRGAAAESHPLSGLMGFLGDTTGAKLGKCADVLRDIANRGGGVRYLKPGEDPIELGDDLARLYVLGPPRDRELIRQADPRGEGQTYGFGALGTGLGVALGAALDAAEPTLTMDQGPFGAGFAILLPAARSLDFFLRRYYADRAPEPAREREDTTQGWRRIDEDWLGPATHLALALDGDTNNTSLVLALELGPPDKGGPVLLFAADAQVGNWLSWQDLEWDVAGRHVTGPDLLARTVVYKVGHHGSHNATLRDGGLEQMSALALALLPTDVAMASKVGWGNFPAPELLERLDEATGGAVVRTDRKLPRGAEGVKGVRGVVETGGWFEVEV